MIIDEFLFADADGTSWIQASRLEAEWVAACRPDAKLLNIDELGLKERRRCWPAQRRPGALVLEGEPLTAESIRAAMPDAAWARGAVRPDSVIVELVWHRFGHEPGSGPLPAHDSDVTEDGCEVLTDFPYSLIPQGSLGPSSG